MMDTTLDPFHSTNPTLLLSRSFVECPTTMESSPRKMSKMKKRRKSEADVNIHQLDKAMEPFLTVDPTSPSKMFKKQKKKKKNSESNVNNILPDEEMTPFQTTDPTLLMPTGIEGSRGKAGSGSGKESSKKKKKIKNSESKVNNILPDEASVQFQATDPTLLMPTGTQGSSGEAASIPGKMGKKKKTKKLRPATDSTVLLPTSTGSNLADSESIPGKKVKENKKRKHVDHDDSEEVNKRQKFSDSLTKGIKIPRGIEKLEKAYVRDEHHRRGLWDKEEKEMLTNNLNTFLKENSVEDGTMLLEYHFEDSEKKSEIKHLIRKKKFYAKLVEGLHRSPRNVFICLYKSLVMRRLTPAEQEHFDILHTTHGDNLGIIAEKMKRPVEVLNGHMKKLQQESKFTKKWTKEEDHHLIEIMGDKMYKDCKLLKTKCHPLKTKSALRCRMRWKMLCWEFSPEKKELPFTDTHKLQFLERIKNQEVTSEESIKWKKISKSFDRQWRSDILKYYWTCVKIQAPLKVAEDYQGLWAYLEAHYIPRLHRQIQQALKGRNTLDVLKQRLGKLNEVAAGLKWKIELKEEQLKLMIPLEEESPTD